MSNCGRRKDPTWLYFDELKNDKRKGCRSKCKSCNKEMEGQIARMKKHLETCGGLNPNSDSDSVDDVSVSSSLDLTVTSKRTSEIRSEKRKRNDTNLDSFISKSTRSQQQIFDEQIARYIYATNSSFNTVDHPEFINMVQSLRPEYCPPSRKRIAGELLDIIHDKEKEKCVQILKNEIVTLALDGWTNVHNEPVICATLTTKDGNTFLIETIDTSGIAHTSENLYDMAIKVIKKCQSEFKCLVHSVVTDNAANVQKMRMMLDENEEFCIITYGCAAHIFNLLANDLNYPNVKEQILNVIKYFRNNQYANACFKQNANACKLIMPSEVRWNSFTSALESYVKAWPMLINICENNKHKIDKNIQNLVANIALKRNAEDYLEQLKPISIALDNAQSGNCTIGEVVHIFKDLKKKMVDSKLNKEVLKKLDNRYKMAITPAHLLAYLLDPKPKDADFQLTSDEKEAALEYAKTMFCKNNLLALILKFCAKSSPFKKYYFESDYITNLTAVEWWQSQEDEIKTFNTNVLKEVTIILTAKASTANVERIFSSFGVVQSKLRNRLGLEKAAKLVFLFKMLNPNSVLQEYL